MARGGAQNLGAARSWPAELAVLDASRRLAPSPWSSLSLSLSLLSSDSVRIHGASCSSAAALGSPAEAPAAFPEDEDAGGGPLHQNGSKVGTIRLGTATAQTSITIDNQTYVQSWIRTGEGSYVASDGYTMTVTATTVTISGGPTAGTYQR